MQKRNLQNYFGTNSTISSQDDSLQQNQNELNPIKQTELLKGRYNNKQSKASSVYYLRSLNNLKSPLSNEVLHQQYNEPKYNSFSPPKTFAFNLGNAKSQQNEQNNNRKNIQNRTQNSLKNQRLPSERSFKKRENKLQINSEIQDLQMRSSVFHNSFAKTTSASSNNPFSVGKNKQKKKHGFFDQFSNKNFFQTSKIQHTQTSFNSNQPSVLSSSFNHNIQNCLSDSDKKVGLLSYENLAHTGMVKSYNKLDNNINPSLKELRDEFYDVEVNNAMPEVQRIRSELYLNSQYQLTQQNNFNETQVHQVQDVQDAFKNNQKKVENIDKFVHVKRYKQPQIGEEEVQKKPKGKLKNGSESRMNAIQAQYESIKQATVESTVSLDVHIRSFQKFQDWHPQGRIGGTLTAINGHLYLIGGRCNELLTDVHMLKIQKSHTSDNTWMSLNLYQKIDFQGEQKLLKSCTQFHQQHERERQRSKTKKLSKLQSFKKIARDIAHVESDEAFTGRFNHTAVSWKKYIVVFGGEQEFDLRYKKRSVLNEVFFFDSVLLTWSRKICRGDAIESRRNHTATMLGDNMMVIGGLNSFEKCPKDLVYLDLQELKWKTYGNQGDYQNIFENSGGLCEHQTCAVYEDFPRQKLHSDKYYKPSLYVKEQGIYIYGGKFQNNKINDSVYLLNTFNFPVKWKKLETMGKPPQKRYSHAMQYDPVARVLIVIGGKTEKKDTIYLDDIWILKMQNYQWMKINVVNQDKYKPISNFSTCMYQSQIFVFGGMFRDGFYDGTMDIQEYDQKRVRQIKNGHTFEQKDEEELKKIRELQLQAKQNETNIKSYIRIPDTLMTTVRAPRQQRKSVLAPFTFENRLVE